MASTNRNSKKGTQNTSSNQSDSIIGRNNNTGNINTVLDPVGPTQKRSHSSRERNVPNSNAIPSQSIPVTESSKKPRTSTSPMQSPTTNARNQALTSNVETPNAEEGKKESHEEHNLEGNRGNVTLPTFSPAHSSDEWSDHTRERRRSRGRRGQDEWEDDEPLSHITNTPNPDGVREADLYNGEALIRHYWGPAGPDGTDLPTWVYLCDGEDERAIAVFKSRLCDQGTNLKDFMHTFAMASDFTFRGGLLDILKSTSINSLDAIVDRGIKHKQATRNYFRSNEEQRPVFSVSTAQVPILRRPHTSSSVQDYLQEANAAKSRHLSWKVSDITDDTGIELLDTVFLAKKTQLLPPGYVEDWESVWSIQTFHENLKLAFSPSSTANSNGRLVEQILAIKPDFGQIPDPDSAARYTNSVYSAVTEARKRNADFNETELVQTIKGCIAGNRTTSGQPKPVNKVNQRLHSLLQSQTEPTNTIRDLSASITAHIESGARDVERALPWLPDNAMSLLFPPKRSRFETDDIYTVIPRPTITRPAQQINECEGLCFGCGKSYNGPGKRCDTCADHPDRNMEDVPFKYSAAYQTQATYMQHPERLRTYHRSNGEEIVGAARDKIDQGKARRAAENAPKAHSYVDPGTIAGPSSALQQTPGRTPRHGQHQSWHQQPWQQQPPPRQRPVPRRRPRQKRSPRRAGTRDSIPSPVPQHHSRPGWRCETRHRERRRVTPTGLFILPC